MVSRVPCCGVDHCFDIAHALSAHSEFLRRRFIAVTGEHALDIARHFFQVVVGVDIVLARRDRCDMRLEIGGECPLVGRQCGQ
jgi:hypothetical protein